MAHSTLVVASSEDADRIGDAMDFDGCEWPHFHCGNLDAGILGQVFRGSADVPQHVVTAGAIEMVHRHSAAEETVVVHALPRDLSERYARINEMELDELSARWCNDTSYIRLPKSEAFNRRVMGEIARLARIAIREDRILFVRTSFRNSRGRQ